MQIDINFKIAEGAVKELKKAMEGAEAEGSNLRVGVQGGGCSGFQYQLGFEEKDSFNEENDILEVQEGINVVIDKKSAIFLNDVTLEWVEDLNQRGFKFNNPNATKSCGCGQSFC